MLIKNDKDLIDIMLAAGWQADMGGYRQPKIPEDAYYFQCPYDKRVSFHRYSREFCKGGCIIAIIKNLRDFDWDYDINTGLLNNGVCAIRIR